MNWKLFSGTSRTWKKNWRDIAVLESVQSCSELSIHLPVFFPRELYIFSSSSRLVRYTDKCMENSRYEKQIKKIYRPTWWVGFTAWRFAAINVENRGNGHTWRMLVISDMPDIGDFIRRSRRSAYKIPKFFRWLFTLFLIELYIRSIFLTCTDRDAQTFNFDFLIFSLCWELPLDGVVSGKGHPFLEI